MVKMSFKLRCDQQLLIIMLKVLYIERVVVYQEGNIAPFLGGGFIFFYFHPGKISILTIIFFRWVGSTTPSFECRICPTLWAAEKLEIGVPRKPLVCCFAGWLVVFPLSFGISSNGGKCVMMHHQHSPLYKNLWLEVRQVIVNMFSAWPMPMFFFVAWHELFRWHWTIT